MLVATHREDSPVGRWTLAHWRAPRLAAAVAGVWHFDGRVARRRERVFPGPFVEIILHLGAPYREVRADGVAGDPYSVANLTGIQTRPLVVEAPDERAAVMGVRLTPLGAYALLGHALSETVGRSVDVRDLLGAEADALAGRCQEARTVEARFAVVDAWAEERLARGPRPDGAVAWAAERLARSHGAASIALLREATGAPERRFTEAFRRQVGLAPKRWARLLRFRRALDLVAAGRPLSLAAQDAGYYDQPHFTAEFRAHAGMTPREYARSVRYHESPSVAEDA